MKYTNFCSADSCVKSTSLAEIEIREYIKSIYNGSVEKIIMDKNELDAYLKDKNLAFEHNGFY
jgi:hypothetical protein